MTERFLGKRMIGTTGRGIGPAYADKINRVGIRLQDLFDENILRQKVEGALDQKNHLLVKVFNRRAITVDEIVDDLLSYAPRLQHMVCDTSLLLNNALDAGEVVVFEGGQATMLDIDHGTYPFVTSSSATAGGAATGAGVGPNRLDRIVGIVKAYTTRVGSGPFPTELFDEQGEWLRSRGFEFGTTTGRPRRVGWYDAPITRYATRINGITDLVLTKLDILTGLEEIPVCVAYDVEGTRFDEVPVNQSDFHHATPILEYFPGWQEDISGARDVRGTPGRRAGLRARARAMSGTRISVIGVGRVARRGHRASRPRRLMRFWTRRLHGTLGRQRDGHRHPRRQEPRTTSSPVVSCASRASGGRRGLALVGERAPHARCLYAALEDAGTRARVPPHR